MEHHGRGHALRASQIAAGESHTLVLTDCGKVFAWGKGLFGRLGTGDTADAIVPVLILIDSEGNQKKNIAETNPSVDSPPKMLKGSFFPRVEGAGHGMQLNVVAIAAGAYHSLALTEDGAVWTWGYNVYGQLGHGSDNASVPHLVTTWDEHKHSLMHVGSECDHKPSKVIAVEAGGMMSCAIDQDGILWIWGRSPFLSCTGSEGSFSLSICERPQPVVAFYGFQVLKVACGNEHVLTMVDRGGFGKEERGKLVCYAWGNNTHGQLGLGDTDSRLVPEHVHAFGKQSVGMLTDIACGAFHSAVLTQSESWEFQTSLPKRDGEFCLEDKVTESEFWHAPFKRKSLCWTFGLGENGQLGHCNSQSIASPKVIESLPEDDKIIVVSCGLFHMGVLTETGGAWTWGMERGLGLFPGTGARGIEAGDLLFPMRVSGNQVFASSHGTTLTCGAAHTVLAANDGSELWAWGRGQNGVLGTGQLVDSMAPCAVEWPPIDPDRAGRMESDFGMHQIKSVDHVEKLTDEANTLKLEKMLALAQREICTLTTELTAMKHYTALLHAALYGVPEPSHLKQAQEILQELEQKIEESSYDDLVQVDKFYRQMRSQVKEVLLKRKMEKLCRNYIEALKDHGQ